MPRSSLSTATNPKTPSQGRRKAIRAAKSGHLKANPFADRNTIDFAFDGDDNRDRMLSPEEVGP